MVQTATETIKRNEATVTLYYGCDGKTCRLMVMAGETAVQKGVNAGAVVKEAAPIFGAAEAADQTSRKAAEHDATSFMMQSKQPKKN